MFKCKTHQNQEIFRQTHNSQKQIETSIHVCFNRKVVRNDNFRSSVGRVNIFVNFFRTSISASRSRRAVKANIAFTAGLSHSILHAPAYQNIIFDDVETNIGNGYNSRIGIFTAPVSGTYVFYTSILVYNNREIFCRIVVNGVNKANAYARGTDNRLDQGSQLIVVQLHQGDQVAVQNKMDDDAIFGNADIWTTFSGFLLHSDVLVG